MQLPAVELHTHPIAKAEVRHAVHSRHERWAARVHSDERIRTERLNAAHLGRSDALVGGNEAYVLGAYAEIDLAFVAVERHGNRPGAAIHYPALLPRPPSPASQDVHARVPDEAGDEDVGRPSVHLGRCAHLAQPPPLEDRDALAHGHGLDLIVGHVHHGRDRKSTRLNSSHLVISYAVFCLKKKKVIRPTDYMSTCC